MAEFAVTFKLNPKLDVPALTGKLDEIKKMMASGLGDSFKPFNEATQGLGASFKTLQSNAAQSIDSIKNSMAMLAVAGEKGSTQYKALGEQLKVAEGEAKKLGDAYGQVGEKTKTGFGNAMIAMNQALQFTQQISGKLSEVMNVGINYDKQLKAVGAFTGTSGKELDALGDKARQLGISFGDIGKAKEQLEIFSAVLSKMGPAYGQNAEAMGIFATNANILAKAGGIDVKQSVDVMTNSMLQFGLRTGDANKDAETSTRIINGLAASARAGAAQIPQVGEAMLQVGVMAKGSKMSFEETAAAIQVMAVGGKTGAEAGVALRNVLGLMQKPTAETELALRKMGLTSAQVGETLTTKGFGAAIELLKGGLQKLPSDMAKNNAMMKMFGMENAAAAGIFMDNIGRYTEFVDAIKEGQQGVGTAFDMFAQKSGSASGTLEKWKSKIQDYYISFSQMMGTGLQSVLLASTQLAPSLTSIAMLGNIDFKAMGSSFASVGTSIWGMVKAAGAFLMTPWGIALASLVAIGTAVHYIGTAYNKTAEERLNDANAQSKLIDAQIKETEQSVITIHSKEKLLEQFKKEGNAAMDNKELILKLANAYPGAIDGSKSYSENLANLTAESSKSTQELENLKGTLIDLANQKIDLTIKIANIKVDVDRNKIEQSIKESLSTPVASMLGKAVEFFGFESTATKEAKKMTQPYIDAIKAAKNDKEIEDAGLKFKLAVINGIGDFKGLDADAKLKMQTNITALVDDQKKVIVAAKKDIINQYNTLKGSMSEDNLLNYLSTSFGKSVDYIKSLTQNATADVSKVGMSAAATVEDTINRVRDKLQNTPFIDKAQLKQIKKDLQDAGTGVINLVSLGKIDEKQKNAYEKEIVELEKSAGKKLKGEKDKQAKSEAGNAADVEKSAKVLADKKTKIEIESIKDKYDKELALLKNKQDDEARSIDTEITKTKEKLAKAQKEKDAASIKDLTQSLTNWEDTKLLAEKTTVTELQALNKKYIEDQSKTFDDSIKIAQDYTKKKLELFKQDKSPTLSTLNEQLVLDKKVIEDSFQAEKESYMKNNEEFKQLSDELVTIAKTKNKEFVSAFTVKGAIENYGDWLSMSEEQKAALKDEAKAWESLNQQKSVATSLLKVDPETLNSNKDYIALVQNEKDNLIKEREELEKLAALPELDLIKIFGIGAADNLVSIQTRLQAINETMRNLDENPAIVNVKSSISDTNFQLNQMQGKSGILKNALIFSDSDAQKAIENLYVWKNSFEKTDEDLILLRKNTNGKLEESDLEHYFKTQELSAKSLNDLAEYEYTIKKINAERAYKSALTQAGDSFRMQEAAFEKYQQNLFDIESSYQFARTAEYIKTTKYFADNLASVAQSYKAPDRSSEIAGIKETIKGYDSEAKALKTQLKNKEIDRKEYNSKVKILDEKRAQDLTKMAELEISVWGHMITMFSQTLGKTAEMYQKTLSDNYTLYLQKQQLVGKADNNIADLMVERDKAITAIKVANSAQEKEARTRDLNALETKIQANYDASVTSAQDANKLVQDSYIQTGMIIGLTTLKAIADGNSLVKASVMGMLEGLKAEIPLILAKMLAINLTDLGPLGLASFGMLSGLVIAAVSAAESKVKSLKFRVGGYTGDLPEDAEAGTVHGKEFVFNARAVRVNDRNALEFTNRTGRPMEEYYLQNKQFLSKVNDVKNSQDNSDIIKYETTIANDKVVIEKLRKQISSEVENAKESLRIVQAMQQRDQELKNTQMHFNKQIELLKEIKELTKQGNYSRKTENIVNLEADFDTNRLVKLYHTSKMNSLARS